MISTHSTDCCKSTCGPGFIDKGGTCPSNYVVKSTTHSCNVEADGTCKITGPEIDISTGTMNQMDNGCCKKTCASFMSELTGAGKCGGNRAAAKKESGEDANERCTDDVCDENTCCPLTCENSLAGQSLTCPSTKQINVGHAGLCNEHGNENPCTVENCCNFGCTVWSTQGGTCSDAGKIVNHGSTHCPNDICTETVCCANPPSCTNDANSLLDNKRVAIGTDGCMCDSSYCGVGKFCYNPTNYNDGWNQQCHDEPAPQDCAGKILSQGSLLYTM